MENKPNGSYVAGGCLCQIIGAIIFFKMMFNENTSALAALIVGGGIFFCSLPLLMKHSAQQEDVNRERRIRDKVEFEQTLIHIGGHPRLQANQTVLIQIRDGNQIVIGNDIINAKDIINCQDRTEEQITKDVTFARLITLGVFAFAAKKETQTINNYLVFSYMLEGIKIDCIFRQSNATQNISNISFRINQLIPKLEVNKIDTSGTKNDILEQVEKLGELKNKGILTEEEFQCKKEKLLSQL